MAINPNTQYPGKIATPDANYPYGGAQNITVPGDGTGTPWEKALVNDIFGLEQALLKSASIVPSGSADKVGASEYLQAIVEIASGRGYSYDESGIADAYVLDVRTNQEKPRSYFTGLKARFTPGNNNTGAATADIAGLGVKNIKDINGNDPVAGALSTLLEAELFYDGLNLILLNPYNHRVDRGTFTPTMKGVTTAGTGWVYGSQIGRWTRTGRILTIDFSIQVTTIGAGAAGIPAIDNLPFTSEWDIWADVPGSLSNVAGITLDHAGNYNQLLMKADVSTGLLIFNQSSGTLWKWMDITDLTTVVSMQGHVLIPLK